MSKLRALVTDDEGWVRMSLKTFLLVRGFEVVEASDGMQALNLLNQGGIDVAFSDVSMPNMNGFEFLARAKRNPKTKTIPVIMLTSESRPEDIAKGKALGCASYLIKPFDRERLGAALEAANLGKSDRSKG